VAGFAPLTLDEGYTVAEYREDVCRFRTAGRQMRDATRTYRTICGGLRLGEVEYRLTRYRCAVRFERDVDRELLTSLPARHPDSYRPGSE
jgi:hypothetical protein